MASQLESHPGGQVTKVHPRGAGREGAYRLLWNEYVSIDALERTRDVACMRRMEMHGGIIVVALDKASIQLSDREGVRDFGSVGNRTFGSRGVQVLTALPLDREAAPLGIAHQQLWARSDTPSPARRSGDKNRKRERDKRPAMERESYRWAEVMREVHSLAQEHAPSVQLWFQLDREGDCWVVHRAAAELGLWTTVRMNKAHVVRYGQGKQGPLMPWMTAQPIEHWLDLHLPAHDGLPNRVARLSVRFGHAWLRLPTPGGKTWVEKWFVFVDEPHRPRAKNRIQWLLATNRPVGNIDDALAVIDNYKRRWRIEDFHRAWKSGCCAIESSQLQSLAAFHRWAILTSSMAARAEHIKLYSRECPNDPATVVYTREEIDTLLLWRLSETPKARVHYQPGKTPRLHEMTRWVAELGGFMKSSKVLPGAATIARGLMILEFLVKGRSLARGRPRASD